MRVTLSAARRLSTRAPDRLPDSPSPSLRQSSLLAPRLGFAHPQNPIRSRARHTPSLVLDAKCTPPEKTRKKYCAPDRRVCGSSKPHEVTKDYRNSARTAR
eukprot:1436705-Rhodomonas_salina.1